MRPLHLLLIDQHDSLRESARKYLRCCRGFASVITSACYSKALFLQAKHYPDLLIIDSKNYNKTFGIINDLETFKPLNALLDVYVLYFFREEHINRGQRLPKLTRGVIFKESFSEDLFKNLAAQRNFC